MEKKREGKKCECETAHLHLLLFFVKCYSELFTSGILIVPYCETVEKKREGKKCE